MNSNDELAQADAELMRRLQRIRELEGEVADQVERIAALEAMLADADAKREYWREQCREFVDQFEVEADA